MSIARHTSYNLFGSIVPLAVSLVTVPLYLRLIGLESYGVLALCWTLLGYLGFLNLGLGPSVAQRMATLGKGEGAKHSSILWTALWISLAMGIAAGLLVYGLADAYFGSLRDPPAGLSGEIAGVKGWLAATIPVVMLASVLTGALQGHERFLASNLISGSASILMSVAPLVVAYLYGPALWGLLAASLGARAVSLVALFIACRSAIPMRGIRLPQRALIKSLLTFGGWITIDSVIGPLLLTFDRFVIGAVLGAAAVSIYTVPYNLVSNIQLIPSALSGVLFPRFAATADAKRSHRLEIESITALAVVMTPITVAIMAVVGPFLVLWIGTDLARQAAPVAYLILFALCPNSAARVPYSRMLGSGRPDLITKIHLAEIPPYLVLLFYGVSHFGVTGAAIAWCARTVVDAVIFLAFAGRPKEAFGQFAAPSLIVCAALALAFVLPMDLLLRWLLFGVLMLVSLAWSLCHVPASLRELAVKLIGRRPKQSAKRSKYAVRQMRPSRSGRPS